nr:MAG TPA: helicase [Caudoviricetes sp.]
MFNIGCEYFKKNYKCNVSDYFPYNEIRPQQKSILDSIDKIYSMGDKYRYIVIEAGTGIGKSAIAKAISAKEGESYLLTATKQLQDQYVDDFRHLSTSAIKGSANYHCEIQPGFDCSSGECTFEEGLYQECLKTNKCPYINAKKKAEASEMYVTSYAYFLRASKTSKNKTKFLPRNVIIVDECHMLEDQLINFAGFTLNREKLSKKYDLDGDLDFKEAILYNMDFESNKIEDNRQWISFILTLLRMKIIELMEKANLIKNGDRNLMSADEIEELEEVDIKNILQDVDSIKTLVEKVDEFLRSDDLDNWIITVDKDSLNVKPINIDNLFKKLIDGFATHKIVFMSATILDKEGFCKDMGISSDNTAFITRDGTFDPKRSPIVYNPIGSMNYQNLNTTMPYVIQEIKEILKQHKNEKGVIHTGTYAIAKQITDAINSSRLVFREYVESNEALIQFHAQTKKNTVLVSPSMMAGVDLADDLSRFQIVVKLPYISLADERVKRKMNKDKKWYTCKMLRNLIQECGRSTRSEDDWSVTYVLDNAFELALKYNKKWFQPSFLNRVVNVSDFDLKSFRKQMKKK